eukprot:Nitzschia sp. Nitz4//scaffold127_size64804//31668//33866//NITZ4_006177-RA/size64804-processed-gene-0.18-mRNA-1//1//CDS//3329534753//5919//frame0
MSSSPQTVLEWKQLALSRKKQGDIEGAKKALLQAKLLEREQQQAAPAELAPVPVPVPAPAAAPATASDTSSATPTETVQEQPQPEAEAEQPSQPQQPTPQAASGFSHEDLLNVELLTELESNGMPVPSLEDYTTAIQECKRQAIQYKQQQQTQKALESLRRMKDLQAMYDQLSSYDPDAQDEDEPEDNEDVDLSAIESQEEYTEEEKALLQEIYDTPDPDAAMDQDMEDNDQELTADLLDDDSEQGTGGGTKLDLQDLVEMDASTLKDAVEMGMQLPSVQEIQAQVDHHKALAVQYKKEGNLAAAKEALVEFKRLSQQVEQVTKLLQKVQAAGSSSTSNAKEPHEVSEQDLEALLNPPQPKEPKKPVAPKPEPPKVKTSQELREEVVRLRDAGKTAEAAQLLKQYKQALAREAHADELSLRKTRLAELQQEIQESQKQQDRMDFVTFLVNETLGQQQVTEWANYGRRCTQVAALIEAKGSQAVTMTRQPSSALRVVPSEEVMAELVEAALDPTDPQVYISVLQVTNLTQTKGYSKLSLSDRSHIQVHVSIQLPVSEQEQDSSIDITLEAPAPPIDSEDPLRFTTPTHTVSSLERGDSKFAKLLLRRMERRKIVMTLNHIVKPAPVSKGWFGGGKQEEVPPPTALGKVTLETKELLFNRCIVGDFPILGGGKRPVGSSLRLCIRTGIPFDPSAVVQPKTMNLSASLPAYAGLTFALNKEQAGEAAKESQSETS